MVDDDDDDGGAFTRAGIAILGDAEWGDVGVSDVLLGDAESSSELSLALSLLTLSLLSLLPAEAPLASSEAVDAPSGVDPAVAPLASM